MIRCLVNIMSAPVREEFKFYLSDAFIELKLQMDFSLVSLYIMHMMFML